MSAANPGGGRYPTIYMAGRVSGAHGIWRSDDDASNWNLLSKYPLDSLDTIRCIEGYSNTYGTCCIGFAGSGAAYYTL